MRVDVVIVGAGIGGAVLALDLGRRGWRVALVERESTTPRIARPEVLWSPTPKALERYGIADAIRERASVKLEAIEIGGEKPWLRITRRDFDAAGVDAFSTNPSITRQIIADAAVATGNVEIHRGIAIEDRCLTPCVPDPTKMPRLQGNRSRRSGSLKRFPLPRVLSRAELAPARNHRD